MFKIVMLLLYRGICALGAKLVENEEAGEGAARAKSVGREKTGETLLPFRTF
jgi:hypothetical protein